MTLGEIKYQVMFQTNNDADDIGDFAPHIIDYINDGYDLLVNAWKKTHTEYGMVEFPRMANDTDIPKVPEWTHRALADWATWLVYRNGNPQKQQRGMAYRSDFERVRTRLAEEGDGEFKHFRNIPE